MRYLSVCSGIEAASVAWHPLSWKPLAFSEIEAFPRAEVFEKKGRACTYCGVNPVYALDHVVPVALGGTNEFANLVPCCDSCNSKKGAKPLGEMK